MAATQFRHAQFQYTIHQDRPLAAHSAPGPQVSDPAGQSALAGVGLSGIRNYRTRIEIYGRGVSVREQGDASWILHWTRRLSGLRKRSRSFWRKCRPDSSTRKNWSAGSWKSRAN